MYTTMSSFRITEVSVKDIRFPTSLDAHGSDAMHTDPDYSCAYVKISTERGVEYSGFGLTFTIGRGTEIVVQAVKSLSYLVVGKDCIHIFTNFAAFWREITSESQMRWLGPEKGVMHLAVAAIVNALWDLWARIEHKPVWKLLVDMSPRQLVSTIDFRYITDVITASEAETMLEEMQKGKTERETHIRKNGYPSYTTQAVGQDLASDKVRCKMVRDVIGPDNLLMVDANQRWEVQQSIDWMKELADLKPLWIEEPTSPDDVLGHAEIAKALAPYGIGVACGEMCCNRVMFKQFLQAKAINFCQIDSCRIGGINEILAMFDYIAISGTMENRLIEHVKQEHDHFER
ncbi:hypothetical protein B566_EDAN002303 [Ephemera danica]|nr:hypothetical protein B566_EDAN002303 [Ephemera danica]